MLNDNELDAALAASTAPRVTKEMIEARITAKRFEEFSPTVTICEIVLDNGFSVRGESACVNPENYDQEIGERIAYDNAFKPLWLLFGFLLAETQFRGCAVAPADPAVGETVADVKPETQAA